MNAGNGPGRARPVSSAVHDIQVREAAPSFGVDQVNNNRDIFKSTA